MIRLIRVGKAVMPTHINAITDLLAHSPGASYDI